MQRSLAEADRSILNGDVDGAEAALERVGNAFVAYRGREQEDDEESDVHTALQEARRVALLKLAEALESVSAVLTEDDLETVHGALEDAKEAVQVFRALNESDHYSGFRNRFPSRLAK
jgi:hypothetical protein